MRSMRHKHQTARSSAASTSPERGAPMEVASAQQSGTYPAVTPSGSRAFIAQHQQRLITEWLEEVGKLPGTRHVKAGALARFAVQLLHRAILPEREPRPWEGPDPDCDLETLVMVCGCLRRRVWRSYGSHVGAAAALDDVLDVQQGLDAAIDASICRAAARRVSAAQGDIGAPSPGASPDVGDERRNLLAVLEQLPAGVVMVDAQTREVLLWNAEGRRITGLHQPGRTLEVMSSHNRALLPNGQPWPAEEDPMLLAIAGRALRNVESIFVHADGTRRAHLLNAGPVRNREGNIVAGLVTVVDISERKMMEQELRNTALFRERFMGILGHDLRSPLNAIYLSAQLLSRQEPPSSAAASATDRILSSAERMTRMIRDLLDFTRGRFGGIPIDAQPVDLRHMCEDVLGEVRAAYPGRSIELRMQGEPRAHCDRDRLAQAVSNLLNNALVHGAPDGAVVMCVRQGSTEFEIAVTNDGVPIPEHELPHLFDPFQRLGRAEGVPNNTGLGLGLYIVQAIALAHGGSVRVSSSAAAGTTFTMSIPVARLGSRRGGSAGGL